MDLNALAATVHAANIKWWQNIDTGKPIERNRFELLALVISEISECLEGERKNLMDDKLPHRRMAEVEMADTYIRLLDFAGGFGFRIHGKSYPVIPNNKGEALFQLMRSVASFGGYRSLGEHLQIESQIAFSLAFIEAYCAKHGYDLMGAFNEKMAFNAQREDHTHEARRIAGGKQF
jgi:hypothetical protein